jgi:hypothetical protein
MPKPKLKYELIDSHSGRTLLRGTSAVDLLTKAAQYMLDYAIIPSEVTYVILSNGAKAKALSAISGAELQQLIDDMDIEPYAEDDMDEWADGIVGEYDDNEGEWTC